MAGIAGGAALGIGIYGGYRLGQRGERRQRVVPPREQPFAPGPFVAIDDTGLVTVWLSKTDLGQGVATSLPMVIADELGADPLRLRVVQAPADDAFGNQLTGVSASVRGMFGEARLDDARCGWTVEVALPWEGLKQIAGGRTMPPKSGDSFRMTAYRCHHDRTTRTAKGWTWSVMGNDNIHIPERWNQVVFVDREA